MPQKAKTKIDKNLQNNTKQNKLKNTKFQVQSFKPLVEKGKVVPHGKPEITAAKSDIQHSPKSKIDVADEHEIPKQLSEESADDSKHLKTPATKRLRLTEDVPINKIIDEIDIEASSSETDYSDYYRQSEQESIEADPEQLLEPQVLTDEKGDTSSEDEELREDEPEYLKQGNLEDIQDFFGNIGDVPDVDEVSLDVTEEVLIESPHSMEADNDLGKFVNPLTGELSTSDDSIQIKEKESIETVAEEQDSISVDVPGSVVISILSDHESENADITQNILDEETGFHQFLELEAHGPIIAVDEIDVEALALEENAKALQLQTYEFVQDLIDRAVEKSEYIDANVILRQNLDKRKLIEKLHEKLATLKIERSAQHFLNRKCVEHFRRKHSFRSILEDNPKTLSQEIEKYHDILRRLDQLLIRENETKNVTECKLQSLKDELETVKQRASDGISNLEAIIKTTLRRENSDKLQMMMTNCLTRMKTVREDISEVRFQLIQNQDNLKMLTEHLRDLENLGNGLTMRNFETIQTENQALGKKNEERNAELNKLRDSYHRDLNQMAHLHEKHTMAEDTITFQRQYMKELQIERQQRRETLSRFKMDRSVLRKNIEDISFQSGLLDKPALMKDYDVTVKYLKELCDRVEQSNTAIHILNEKISLLKK